MNIDTKRVIQDDSTGCGLACVAMLSGYSYAHVRKKAIEKKILQTNGDFYTNFSDIRNLLIEFKITAGERKLKRQWKNLPLKSIVEINFNKDTKNWHWVVCINEEIGMYVLDPNKKIRSNKRTDFNRMRIRSYIPING